MSDTVSKAKRSEIMRRVRGSNTEPERLVRSILHRLGGRFRLSSGIDLPGHPDIVLPSRNLVVFIHGCFWHQHRCSRGARRPLSNVGYWDSKLTRNIQRDRRVTADLRWLGWKVVIVWECETRNPRQLRRRLQGILSRVAGRRTNNRSAVDVVDRPERTNA